MSRNEGKKFEDDFAQSATDSIMIHRLPDAAQSFGGSNNLRFSRKNPFDFFLYAGRNYDLMALELKSVTGKSVSFERSKDDKGIIHYHQIQGLLDKSKYPDITAGFVINYRDLEQTYFIDINQFIKMIESISKKSFNIDDLLRSSPILIPQKKKRTRYLYDLQTLLQYTQ